MNIVTPSEAMPVSGPPHPTSNGHPLPTEKVSLRRQGLQIPPDLRQQKPSAKHVIVLSYGSFAIRYGFAADSTPRMVFPAVAIPRNPNSHHPPFRVPPYAARSDESIEASKRTFETRKEAIAHDLALADRRRGGGRPIPWKAAVENVVQTEGVPERKALQLPKGKILVGHDVQLLLLEEERAKNYDIIMPIWDGKLLFDCGAPVSLIRKALDAIHDYIVEQLVYERKHGKINSVLGKVQIKQNDSKDTTIQDSLFVNDGMAKSFVTVVVPETSQRRDVAEIVDSVYRSNAMQTAAMFIHQSAVSCALGAGLATCAVVDIGHSATTIACVEDGVVCGESRIHLEYGSSHIQNMFLLLLRDHSNLYEVLASNPDSSKQRPYAAVQEDLIAVTTKAAEQMGAFNVDENDTLNVAMVKAPSGRSLRIKLGVGIRTLPCYGLIHPTLLKSADEIMTLKKLIPSRGPFERNSEDDNFVSDIFNDLRRSGIATAALPIGTFANDPGQPAAATVNSKEASIVDAIIWSIAKAVEIKRPDQQSRTADHYRRYLNAIVLAGGGASIDGIALALEGRIKKGFLDSGLSIGDVTVIDGGKGKGDEELAAAAAVLKEVDSEGGIVDDTDTASLPWKGGAVMVEADAVNEYWIYRDDWLLKNVRALRERAPFYW